MVRIAVVGVSERTTDRDSLPAEVLPWGTGVVRVKSATVVGGLPRGFEGVTVGYGESS